MTLKTATAIECGSAKQGVSVGVKITCLGCIHSEARTSQIGFDGSSQVLGYRFVGRPVVSEKKEKLQHVRETLRHKVNDGNLMLTSP